METQKIIFEGITASEFFDRINARISELKAQSQHATVDERKPLSIDDAADFTGLKKPTLYKMTSEGSIPFHKQGGKLWFFRDELVSWIKGESKA
jgi:excisionase family DNA binding protein